MAETTLPVLLPNHIWNQLRNTYHEDAVTTTAVGGRYIKRLHEAWNLDLGNEKTIVRADVEAVRPHGRIAKALQVSPSLYVDLIGLHVPADGLPVERYAFSAHFTEACALDFTFVSAYAHGRYDPSDVEGALWVSMPQVDQVSGLGRLATVLTAVGQ